MTSSKLQDSHELARRAVEAKRDGIGDVDEWAQGLAESMLPPQRSLASQQAMRDLHKPIPDWEPNVPPEYLIEPTGEPVNLVNLTEHRVKWQYTMHRLWPEKWTEWLHQFLAHLSTAQHREWLDVVLGQEHTSKSLAFHTSVVTRILGGQEFESQAPVQEPERTYGRGDRSTIAEQMETWGGEG